MVTTAISLVVHDGVGNHVDDFGREQGIGLRFGDCVRVFERRRDREQGEDDDEENDDSDDPEGDSDALLHFAPPTPLRFSDDRIEVSAR